MENEIVDAVGNSLQVGDLVLTHALQDSDTGKERGSWLKNRWIPTGYNGIGILFCTVKHLTADGNIVLNRLNKQPFLTFRDPTTLLKYEGKLPQHFEL